MKAPSHPIIPPAPILRASFQLLFLILHLFHGCLRFIFHPYSPSLTSRGIQSAVSLESRAAEGCSALQVDTRAQISLKVASALVSSGYTQVYFPKEGLKDWRGGTL
jgi:hypothetical protein